MVGNGAVPGVNCSILGYTYKLFSGQTSKEESMLFGAKNCCWRGRLASFVYSFSVHIFTVITFADLINVAFRPGAQGIHLGENPRLDGGARGGFEEALSGLKGLPGGTQG